MTITEALAERDDHTWFYCHACALPRLDQLDIMTSTICLILRLAWHNVSRQEVGHTPLSTQLKTPPLIPCIQASILLPVNHSIDTIYYGRNVLANSIAGII